MSEKPEWTYAEAYKFLRSIQLYDEPGPCGEYAEFLAWATVKHGGYWIEIFEPKLYAELEKEYDSLKAEGIFNIQHG
jgi:hypothetical protein